MLPDRNPTLLFLWPLPSNCVDGVSRLVRFAERAAELFPTPLLVAEFGATLEPEGSLLADIDGDGEEVEELIPPIPFVWIPKGNPGGTGRFIFEDSDWVAVADGAISISAWCKLDHRLRFRNALTALLRYRRFILALSI
jgi:hypothetical protein